MASDAILVFGVRFYYSDDGVSYTEIPDLRELGSPGTPEAPDVDVTPLYDTVAARQFKAGLVVGGDVEFKQYFKKARLTLLLARMRSNIWWRMVFPDNSNPTLASRLDWRGYLKRVTVSPQTNPDDPVTIDCVQRITGGLTFTEGT